MKLIRDGLYGWWVSLLTRRADGKKGKNKVKEKNKGRNGIKYMKNEEII
jgi:hypothetical protein